MNTRKALENLGFSGNSKPSQQEIRQKYLTLLKKYHSDKAEQKNSDILGQIQEAYNFLHEEKKSSVSDQDIKKQKLRDELDFFYQPLYVAQSRDVNKTGVPRFFEVVSENKDLVSRQQKENMIDVFHERINNSVQTPGRPNDLKAICEICAAYPYLLNEDKTNFLVKLSDALQKENFIVEKNKIDGIFKKNEEKKEEKYSDEENLLLLASDDLLEKLIESPGKRKNFSTFFSKQQYAEQKIINESKRASVWKGVFCAYKYCSSNGPDRFFERMGFPLQTVFLNLCKKLITSELCNEQLAYVVSMFNCDINLLHAIIAAQRNSYLSAAFHDALKQLNLGELEKIIESLCNNDLTYVALEIAKHHGLSQSSVVLLLTKHQVKGFENKIVKNFFDESKSNEINILFDSGSKRQWSLFSFLLNKIIKDERQSIISDDSQQINNTVSSLIQDKKWVELRKLICIFPSFNVDWIYKNINSNILQILIDSNEKDLFQFLLINIGNLDLSEKSLFLLPSKNNDSKNESKDSKDSKSDTLVVRCSRNPRTSDIVKFFLLEPSGRLRELINSAITIKDFSTCDYLFDLAITNRYLFDLDIFSMLIKEGQVNLTMKCFSNLADNKGEAFVKLLENKKILEDKAVCQNYFGSLTDVLSSNPKIINDVLNSQKEKVETKNFVIWLLSGNKNCSPDESYRRLEDSEKKMHKEINKPDLINNIKLEYKAKSHEEKAALFLYLMENPNSLATNRLPIKKTVTNSIYDITHFLLTDNNVVQCSFKDKGVEVSVCGKKYFFPDSDKLPSLKSYVAKPVMCC